MSNSKSDLLRYNFRSDPSAGAKLRAKLVSFFLFILKLLKISLVRERAVESIWVHFQKSVEKRYRIGLSLKQQDIASEDIRKSRSKEGRSCTLNPFPPSPVG